MRSPAVEPGKQTCNQTVKGFYTVLKTFLIVYPNRLQVFKTSLCFHCLQNQQSTVLKRQPWTHLAAPLEEVDWLGAVGVGHEMMTVPAKADPEHEDKQAE